MTENFFLVQVLALALLAPALWGVISKIRAAGENDIQIGVPLLVLAAFGPWLWSVLVLTGGWHTDFGFSIWVSVSAALILFTVLASQIDAIQRLAVLVLPYLSLLLVLGMVMGAASSPPVDIPESWVMTHILVAVATYALLTLAALAAVGVFLKEKALKKKHSSFFFRILPPVSDAEKWQNRLTFWAEIILGIGVMSGVAIQAQRGGPWMVLDHKTLLALIAFAVIGILLFLQMRSGLRGRQAARWVMMAYLLVTLAYPGVKLITHALDV